MKSRFILLFLGILSSGWLLDSCQQNSQPTTTTVPSNDHRGADQEDVVLMDYGPRPTVLNIETYTSSNNDFRNTLWTGNHLQVTLMTIPVGGEVGLEQHSGIDQFLRIEEGEGRVMMGDSREILDFVETAGEDFAVMVPAGKWHNIVNTGNKPLKLYSIYAPAEHPHGTVHKTFQEAMDAEHLH